MLFSQNNQENKSDGEQRSEDIDVYHRIVNRGHNNYDFVNIKQIDQKKKESINPNNATIQLNLSAKNGPIKTEAKNICAISEEISDSLVNLEFDNVRNANFIHHNNTVNVNILSTKNPSK